MRLCLIMEVYFKEEDIFIVLRSLIMIYVDKKDESFFVIKLPVIKYIDKIGKKLSAWLGYTSEWVPSINQLGFNFQERNICLVQ